MNVLRMFELSSFKDDLKRDVIIDGQNRPTPMDDKEFTLRVIDYGNAYLLRHIAEHKAPDTILWFDISFDQPDGKTTLGMTWAYNSRSPAYPLTGMSYFWRMWSEILPPDEFVQSIEQVRQELAAYSLQGLD